MARHFSTKPVNRIDPDGYFFRKIKDKWNTFKEWLLPTNPDVEVDGMTSAAMDGLIAMEFQIDALSGAAPNLQLSKTRHTQKDTGLKDLDNEEIQRRARDRSLPGYERRRYQTEEKYRKERNKQKRNKIQLEPPSIGLPPIWEWFSKEPYSNPHNNPFTHDPGPFGRINIFPY